MWATLLSPSTRISPRVSVVLPAAESPTTPRMTGRGTSEATGAGSVGGEQGAGEDVLGLERDELLARRRAGVLEQPRGLAQPRPVDRVADAARVGEPGARDAALDVGAERLARGVAELVGALGEHQLGDGHELLGVVVREADVMRDARAHPGVGAEERLHPVVVAGQDDHEPVAVGLHGLEQHLDRLLPVVALVLGAVQVVGLVDEQHAAVGALDDLLGLGRGMAHVLPDQVVAGHGHHPRRRDVAQRVEDRGHAQRDGRLAGARVAREAHVQRGAGGREADVLAQPLDHQQRGDLADAPLDGLERDQLAVELGEQRVDPRRERRRGRCGGGHAAP